MALIYYFFTLIPLFCLQKAGLMIKERIVAFLWFPKNVAGKLLFMEEISPEKRDFGSPIIMCFLNL